MISTGLHLKAWYLLNLSSVEGQKEVLGESQKEKIEVKGESLQVMSFGFWLVFDM